MAAVIIGRDRFTVPKLGQPFARPLVGQARTVGLNAVARGPAPLRPVARSGRIAHNEEADEEEGCGEDDQMDTSWFHSQFCRLSEPNCNALSHAGSYVEVRAERKVALVPLSRAAASAKRWGRFSECNAEDFHEPQVMNLMDHMESA